MRRPSAAPSCSPHALAFLLVTVFIDILGLGLVVPIAPQLVAGLGGGSVYFGVLAAGYGLMWAASLTMTGMAPYGWMLYPLLAIGSLGAMTGPPTLSWVSRAAGDRTQGTVHAALSSASSLTETVVPVPAAALFAWSAAAGWPGLVFGCVAINVIVGVVHLARAGQPPRTRRPKNHQQSADQPVTLGI